MKTRNYLKGMFLTEKQVKSAEYDFSVIEVTVKTADLIASLQENTNEKGYSNLIIAKRQKVNESGNTHTIYFNNFVKPDADAEATAEPVTAGTDTPEDLPF